ncbi:MAG: hypothetical protein LBJ46_10595 [Planctomycetota bacterium]|jgi:hypothetical protein|nr:hypothetical protein [Planctomycetota bacterium]
MRSACSASLLAALVTLWLPNAFSSNPASRDFDPLRFSFRSTGAVIDVVTPSSLVSLPAYQLDQEAYFAALAKNGPDVAMPDAADAGPALEVYAHSEVPWAAFSAFGLVFRRDVLHARDSERIIATMMARQRESQEQRRRRGFWRDGRDEALEHGDGHHIELELEQKHKSKKDKQAEKDDDANQKVEGGKTKDAQDAKDVKDKVQDTKDGGHGVKHDAKDKKPVEKDKQPFGKDKQPFDGNRMNTSDESQRILREKKVKNKDGKAGPNDGGRDAVEDRKRRRL